MINPLTKTVVFSIVLALCLISATDAILKQLLGAAIMGDIIPAFYSLQCVNSRSNFTSFLLYTRDHPDVPRPLVPNNWKTLQKSEFDSSLPTKVIIHGFVDNQRFSDWMIRMKNALLRTGDYNVIITDWSCGNGFPYNQAIVNSKKTAEKLGDLILFLKETRGANLSNFHLIGHSLGSHISSLVGHRMRGLGRISALDPAGPKFYDVPLEERLDPLDANFVDVIHTDAGNGLLEGLGLQEQVGHVDFYPNGGRTQPGCHSSPFSVLSRVGLQRAARYYVTCDHFRAVDFYIESISVGKRKDSYCEFVGVTCRDWQTFSNGRCADCSKPENCAHMGFYSDKYPFRNSKDSTREFYVKTSENDPYCLHQYQVLFETGGSEANLRQTDSDFESGVKSGVIYLQMKTSSGKISTLMLNDRNEDTLKPSKRYVYLATSKYPLGRIETATLWWGKEVKPTTEASSFSSLFGFQLKKVQIVPIRMQEKLESRSSDSAKIVLCGEEEKFITKNRLFHLSVSHC